MLISKEKNKCNKLSWSKIITNDKLVDLSMKLHNRRGKNLIMQPLLYKKKYFSCLNVSTWKIIVYIFLCGSNNLKKAKPLQIKYLSFSSQFENCRRTELSLYNKLMKLLHIFKGIFLFPVVKLWSICKINLRF